MPGGTVGATGLSWRSFSGNNCKKLCKGRWNLKRHMIVGHKSVVFGPRVSRSSLSSSKSASGVGKVEVVLEPGLELVKLLGEWEVMGLGTRI